MMSKIKKDIDNCTLFINKIIDYCNVQEQFYNKIAQSGDRSEEFVNRMTDMATAFHSVGQYLDICTEIVLSEMMAGTLGDSNFTLGQVEQPTSESTTENINIETENPPN